MNLVLGRLLPTGERSSVDGLWDPQAATVTAANQNTPTARAWFAPTAGVYDSEVAGWQGTSEP